MHRENHNKLTDFNSDKSMASINQLVSEMAHSLGQPNNHALRENLKYLIIHTRNEVIRHSYENHNYMDSGLMQRFKVSLTEIYDGEIELPKCCCGNDIEIDVTKIRRSTQKVPRPVRLTNNLPFHRVSSLGFETNREYPYIKETTARFRSSVPGLRGMPCYDYINGYIYIFPINCRGFVANNIIIQSAFEAPTFIEVKNGETDEFDALTDNNEWLLSEDMIGQIKDIITKRDLLNNHRETDEIPDVIRMK